MSVSIREGAIEKIEHGWHGLVSGLQAIYHHPFAFFLDYPYFSILLLFIAVFSTLSLGNIIGIFRFQRSSLFGEARWANKQEVLDSELLAPSGVVLGKWKSFYLCTNKPLSILVLAPPGTGKTSAIVVPSLFSIAHSVVVHDPKGELYHTTKHYRSHFSQVQLLDFTARESVTFNPLCKSVVPQSMEERAIYVDNVVASFIPESKQGDRFFVDQARLLLSFIVEFALLTEEQPSFSALYQMISRDENFGIRLQKMLHEVPLPEHVMIKGKTALANLESEKQWAGVVGVMMQYLKIYADPRIAEITSGENQVNIAQMRKKPTSLYLVLRDIDRERLLPIVHLFFTFLAHQLFQQMPGKNDVPVTYILDEFTRLGNIPALKDLPSYGRGFGVNALWVAQDYGQIEECYGKEGRSQFETNCAYKVIFCQNNSETAEQISRSIGNYTAMVENSSRPNSWLAANDKKQISVQQQSIAFIKPQDVMNLKQKECIILVQGLQSRPIAAEKCFWFQERIFRKRGKAA